MSSVGIGATLASLWLGTLRNTPYSAPLFCIKLHTGIPGSDGTSNPSAVTTRQAASVLVSGNSLTLSALPSFNMTAAEDITHLSVWTDLTAGTFLFSLPLQLARTVANGDVYTLNSLTVNFTGVAA